MELRLHSHGHDRLPNQRHVADGRRLPRRHDRGAVLLSLYRFRPKPQRVGGQETLLAQSRRILSVSKREKESPSFAKFSTILSLWQDRDSSHYSVPRTRQHIRQRFDIHYGDHIRPDVPRQEVSIRRYLFLLHIDQNRQCPQSCMGI